MEGPALERSDSQWQLEDGHLRRPWPSPQEDETPSLMAPQAPKTWRVQLPGPSVLEFKVRALKEERTTGQQGLSSGPTAHRRLKYRRVKTGGTEAPAGGSSLPDALLVAHGPSLTDGQLEGRVTEEEPAEKECLGPPRPPAPRLECWGRRSPRPPETAWPLLDPQRAPLPGPASLQDSPLLSAAPSRAYHKVTHTPTPRRGWSHLPQDGQAIGEDPDSTSLTSEEDFDPRTALLGVLWRAADQGALGPGGRALSLSERVERNRLLLQEMLSVSGQGPPKAGILAWSPSWEQAAPERPAGHVDWDSGISLQDSDQKSAKPEPTLSPSHENATHLLQHARMKARTRPLRASHDIMPFMAPGSRDGRRSPARDPRMPLPFRDSPTNGNLSDSSSGDSSGGLWPKRGPSPTSHVRFEDESAHDVQFRYQERLQQRQRRGLSPGLRAAVQGPLRSKPDLADYMHRDSGAAPLHPPAPPRDCESCVQRPHPDSRVLQELEAACPVDRVLAESFTSGVPSAPVRPRSQWIRETHIGAVRRPEEVDSAPDSTDTSDSGRTDSEETTASHPSRARGRARAARPRGGHRWSGKVELPQGPQAQPQLLVDQIEAGRERTEGRGQWLMETGLPGEDAAPTPPSLDSKRAPLGSSGWPRPGLDSACAHLVVSHTPCRTAAAKPSSMKGPQSGPEGQTRVMESQEPATAYSTSSLQQSQVEPAAPHSVHQPAASFSCKSRVPTPPSSRQTASSPVPHGKAALARPRSPSGQEEPADSPLPPPRSGVRTTCETPPCSLRARHPQLALSTNCNNSDPWAPQESWGKTTPESRVERGPCSREPELPQENSQKGGPRPAGVGTISAMGTTLSLEEPTPSQEPSGGLQRRERRSGGHGPAGASPEASAGPRPPPAAPSAPNRRSSSSIASSLGLKKLFAALGQSTRPKLGKSRSYSAEHLQPSSACTPKVTRAPSLQSLRSVSPSHQHRKATSFQNLHSLLSHKVDRSSLYLVGESGDHSASGRLAKAQPRRTLSVEDVSAPSLARTVGRVVEVFPDGTSQLQLQRSPEGTFGFRVASGNGRRDSGFYVQEMADANTAKLYSGLLGVGDELLEVNGAKVAGLGLAHVSELLAHAQSLSLRVLRQRPAPR
ncbi:uncharacterized protein KIAA1614 homolog isoform X2 [Tenrec ecaudatus]